MKEKNLNDFGVYGNGMLIDDAPMKKFKKEVEEEKEEEKDEEEK